MRLDIAFVCFCLVVKKGGSRTTTKPGFCIFFFFGDPGTPRTAGSQRGKLGGLRKQDDPPPPATHLRRHAAIHQPPFNGLRTPDLLVETWSLPNGATTAGGNRAFAFVPSKCRKSKGKCYKVAWLIFFPYMSINYLRSFREKNIS